MANKYKKKKKLKKIFILVPLIVIFLGTLVGFATATEIVKKHIRLDTGVIFVWSDGNGNWQNDLYPNGSCERNANINIGKGDFKNFIIDVYNGSNFPFSNESTCHWNKTVKCQNGDDFNNNYLNYCANFNGGSASYDKTTGALNIKESVTLTSVKQFNVAEKVRKNLQQEVYDYLGGNPPSSITTPMNQMLTDTKVQGYLYFCPMVITYDEVTLVPFGTFIAGVETLDSSGNIKDSFKVGESFTVHDTTVIDSSDDAFKSSELYQIIDGQRTKVKEWDGTQLGSEIEVMTRRDPDRKGYCEFSYDGGKTWIDGGKLEN